MQKPSYRLGQTTGFFDNYKALAIFTAFLLFSICSFAQVGYDSLKNTQRQSSYGFDWNVGKFRSGLIIPNDTPRLAIRDSGSIAYKAGKFWIYNGNYWIETSSGTVTVYGPNVDSLTFSGSVICQWYHGVSTCTDNRQFHAFQTTNYNQTRYLNYNISGDLLDSVPIPHTDLFIDEGITTRDTSTSAGPGMIISAPIKAVKKTVAGMRLITAPATDVVYHTYDYGGGFWNYDSTDVTSADNTGKVLVTTNGKRFKRVYSGAVNILWFGAIPNDGLSDRDAFKKAIAATVTGERIDIPIGTFNTDSTIVFTSSRYLHGLSSGMGEGSRINPTASFADSVDLISITNGYSFMDNIYINMNRQGASAVVYHGEVGNIIFENNRIENVSVRGWGVFGSDTLGTNGICCSRFVNNFFYNFDGGGYYFNGLGDDMEFRNNNIQLVNSSSYLWYIIGVTGAARLKILGGSATGASKMIRIHSILEPTIRDVQIEATTVVNNAQQAIIMLGDVVGHSVIGADISHNNINCHSGFAKVAIYVNDVQDASISNNTIFGADTSLRTGPVTGRITFNKGYDFISSGVHFPISDAIEAVSINYGTSDVNGKGGTVLRGGLTLTGTNSTGLRFGELRNVSGLFDIDPVVQNTSQIARIRLFRQTATTIGAREFIIYNGSDGNEQHGFTNTNAYVNAWTGNFGVGTVSPQAKFHVLSTAEAMRIANTGTHFVSLYPAVNGGLGIIGNPSDATLGAGNVSIGSSSPDPVSTLGIFKKLTGANNLINLQFGGQIQSDLTFRGTGALSLLTTVAGAYRVPEYYDYSTTTGTIGAGSSVGIRYNHYAPATTGADTTYGFASDIPVSSGNRGLKITGTAYNFLAGGLGIGSETFRSSFFSVAQPGLGLGTISTTATGTTVTGTNTSFTGTFAVGQTITANGETRTITAIASDVSMITDAWTNTNSGISYTLTSKALIVANGNGKIGIGGVTAPDSSLHLLGSLKLDIFGKGAGKVLTSDANGGAKWAVIPTDATKLDTSSNYISSGTINWPGTVYTTPTTGIVSNHAITYSPALANQSAYKVFGRASGSGVPSFLTLDSNYLTGMHTQAYFDTRYALAGAAANATVGSSTISSGTTTRILYDNAGVLGEYTLTGTGTVAVMAISPTITTDITSPQYINTINSIGTGTTSVGLLVQNTTAAAAGAQQNTPALKFKSFGWGTTASTSQSLDWWVTSRPVQSTVPTSELYFTSGLNGTPLVNSMILSSAGTLTVAGVNSSLGFTSTRGGNAASSSDGIITQNFTAATSGVPVQISSRLRLSGSAWDGAASKVADFGLETIPVNGTSPITSYLKFTSQINAGGYNEVMRISDVGKMTFPYTIVATGTTGAQTINKPSGSVNFAAGATSIVVTNSLCLTTSEVLLQVQGGDATATTARVSIGAGSFTITLNAAATAETRVSFFVFN